MSKVFVGGVSQEGLALIKSYLDKYMPDAEIEELPVVGIKGKVRNQGKRPDVALIILDTSLYQQCVGVADDVLSLPKVHKYEDDDSLKQFLMDKFGVELESEKTNTGNIEVSGESDSSLKDEVKRLSVVIQSKDATITNLRNRIRELSLDNEDLNTYIDKIEYLESQLSAVSSGSKGGEGGSVDSDVLIANLEVRNKNLQTELDALRLDYSKVKSEYDRLKNISDDTEKTEIEMNSLKTKITSLEEDLRESRDLVKSLEEQVKQLDEARLELSKKCALLESSEGISSELKCKLEASKTSLDVVTAENEDLKSQLVSLRDELKETKDLLVSSENVVKTLTDEVSKVSESSAQSTQLSVDLSKANDTITSLTTSLDIAKADVVERENKIASLNEGIKSLEESIEKKDEEISSLNVKIGNLTADLESLQSKDYDSLSAKCEELKEKLSVSEDSLATIRKEYSLAIVDINKLKEQLESVSSSPADTAEVSRLKRKCEEQAGDLEEMQDFLNDIKLSPFFSMMNYALPKVAMPLALDVQLSFKKSKFVLMATGSGESAAPMYSVLKERCEKSKKSYLIVDLVTESFIDSSVGLTASLPAYSWLSGGDVTSCIVDTKLDNVSAVTTGVGYVNDLFFLSVDWTSRLSLLDGVADVILFNIGCLDSAVRLTLFNSLIDVCDICNIFVKATPTNLRTTLNHLSSLVNLGISSVVCLDSVDIGTGASKLLFNKLSSKCDTVVYSEDTDLGW